MVTLKYRLEVSLFKRLFNKNSTVLNIFKEITLNILFFNTFFNFCDIIVFIKEGPFFDICFRKIIISKDFLFVYSEIILHYSKFTKFAK